MKMGTEMKQQHFIHTVSYGITVNWCGCQWVCRQLSACLCTHVQWFSCQNDRADYCDIIEGHHKNLSCIKGREV